MSRVLSFLVFVGVVLALVSVGEGCREPSRHSYAVEWRQWKKVYDKGEEGPFPHEEKVWDLCKEDPCCTDVTYLNHSRLGGLFRFDRLAPSPPYYLFADEKDLQTLPEGTLNKTWLMTFSNSPMHAKQPVPSEKKKPLETLPPEDALKADLTYWLAQAEDYFFESEKTTMDTLFQRAPLYIREHPDVMTRAVKHHGNKNWLLYGAAEFRTNRTWVEKWVEYDGEALKYVDPSFKHDLAIVKKAVADRHMMYYHIPREMQYHKEILPIVIPDRGELYGKIAEDTEFKASLQDLLEDRALALAGVKYNGPTIQWIKEEYRNDPEFWRAAVSSNSGGNAFPFIPDEVYDRKDVMMAAESRLYCSVDKSTHRLRNAEKEVAMAGVEHCSSHKDFYGSLTSPLREDKDIVRLAVRKMRGTIFDQIPEVFRGSQEVVLEALRGILSYLTDKQWGFETELFAFYSISRGEESRWWLHPGLYIHKPVRELPVVQDLLQQLEHVVWALLKEYRPQKPRPGIEAEPQSLTSVLSEKESTSNILKALQETFFEQKEVLHV